MTTFVRASRKWKKRRAWDARSAVVASNWGHGRAKRDRSPDRTPRGSGRRDLRCPAASSSAGSTTRREVLGAREEIAVSGPRDERIAQIAASLSAGAWQRGSASGRASARAPSISRLVASSRLFPVPSWRRCRRSHRSDPARGGDRGAAGGRRCGPVVAFLGRGALWGMIAPDAGGWSSSTSCRRTHRPHITRGRAQFTAAASSNATMFGSEHGLPVTLACAGVAGHRSHRTSTGSWSSPLTVAS